jgi:hypothetical protein
MAEFEELRLTVNLVDNASSGLQRIRAEIGQLTQSAGQMTTGLASASAGLTNFGNASQRVAPGVRTLSTELRSLERSMRDVGTGVVQMGTAFQGLSGLPQIAAGVYQMSGGVRGLGESLTLLAPSARVSALAVGALAIGVVGLGAAVIAYGVSVFRFAKEMDQLSRTAKAMGASFAEVKLATEYARQYGLSAEAAIQNLSGLQKAQTDLAQSGSKLRQEMVGKGLDPNWLNQFAQETEAWKAQNMVREKGLAIQKELEAKGWNRRAARGIINELAQGLGQDAGIYDRPARVAPTAQEMAELKRAEELSGSISKIWGEIDTKLQKISFNVLAWGLPYLKSTLEEINNLMDKFAAARAKAKEGGSDKLIDNQFLRLEIQKNSPFRQLLESYGIVGPSAPTSNESLGALKSPSSYQGAADNNPLLHRAAFTTDELIDETGKNTSQTEKLTAQLEKLNAFFDRAEGRSASRQNQRGGGVMNAAYSPDAGGAGGGAAGSFGSADYPSLGGGGNAAGRAGIPGGGGGAMPGGVTHGEPGGGEVPAVMDRGGAGVQAPGVSAGGSAGITAPAGAAIARKGLSTVTSSGGRKFQVDERFAANFQGFINDYEKAGGKIGPESGTLGHRPHNRSGHPIGAAIDINQVGYGIRGRGGRTLPVDTENALAKKWGLVSGEQWSRKDTGHFGIRSVETARQALIDQGVPPADATKQANAEVAARMNGGAGGGGDGNPYLAQQRARLKNELDDNPELKKRFAAIVDLENPGAGTAVAESAMNRAAMSGRSMESILQGGRKSFYGPARKGLVEPRMSELARNPDALAARMRQIDEAAAGSNQTKGGTDQGSAGDPNYLAGGTGVNINRERFNDWGGYKGVGYSRQWREAQQQQVDRAALDRPSLSKTTEVNATGKLSVDVNAPPSTTVEASGTGPFKNTELQRSTQMPYTQSGPNAADTANQYMAGR